MQLVVGPARFPVGQVEVVPSVRPVFNRAGELVFEVWTIFARGDLLVTDPDGSANAQELSLLSAAMRRALEDPRNSLTFLDPAGRPTDTTLLVARTTGGVRLDFLRFEDDQPGSWVTRRPFSFQSSAEFPAGGNPLLEWAESITRVGTGGPKVIHQPAVAGPLPAIRTQQFTVCRTVVSGRAVGYRAYPAAPPPLFSGPGVVFMNPEQAVTHGEPDFRGVGGLFTWPVEWKYEFESQRPLAGLPRVWPGRRI